MAWAGHRMVAGNDCVRMIATLLFLKSILVGIAVAAPIGPVGTLCINRTLHRGFLAGMAGGIGAAFADAFFAAVAAVGMAAFTLTIAAFEGPLKIGGGLFMVALGLHSMTPHPGKTVATLSKRGLIRTVGASFLLTLANPITVLSFAAIFAALGMAEAAEWLYAILVVGGVLVGALGWWLLLCSCVAMARHRLQGGFARWASRLSGGMIVMFGLAALGSYFWTRLGL